MIRDNYTDQVSELVVIKVNSQISVYDRIRFSTDDRTVLLRIETNSYELRFRRAMNISL